MTPLLSYLTPVFPQTEAHPAFFLDRDDTLIPDLPYRNTPEGMALCPNAGEALRMLRQAGYRLILLSNQSGIGRGKITLPQLEAVHKRMEEILSAEGVQLDASYYCPHNKDEGCPCRKPATGLYDAACQDFNILRDGSAMAGDRPADLKLAKAAGIQAIQVKSATQEILPEAACVVPDLLGGAQWLLKLQGDRCR